MQNLIDGPLHYYLQTVYAHAEQRERQTRTGSRHERTAYASGWRS